MRKLFLTFTGLAAMALVSCNAPYGNGVQQLVPRADVESVERQAPVSPAPSAGADGYNAVQYGLDNRFGGFHGYGRRGLY